MKGTYCLIILLPTRRRIPVGALGTHVFPPGIYVYVGSALSGMESRVRRHKSLVKRMKWHIDYLLEKAEILSTVAIPSETKQVECEVVQTLLQCEGARTPIRGFGSSDCTCDSHLIYFGDQDAEWVFETISLRLSMLECMYPRSVPSAPKKG
jgi:Uri superfamily endonuclease